MPNYLALISCTVRDRIIRADNVTCAPTENLDREFLLVPPNTSQGGSPYPAPTCWGDIPSTKEQRPLLDQAAC